MGAVIVLTPIVISAWPAISAAVAGAASSLGFAIATGRADETTRGEAASRVEEQMPESEILDVAAGQSQTISIVKDGVTVEFHRDERNSCRMCISGNKSRGELKRIGAEVSGRVVQQFAYHKLVTELKKRNYGIVEEKVQQDQSIKVRVRFNG